MTIPKADKKASSLQASTVFPVVLPVPLDKQQLTGRPHVAYLSRRARRAAWLSAEKSGEAPTGFFKNPEGAPIPENGLYWSISHKREYVAGVVARYPIGIDIEKIRPCSNALIARVADSSEWDLSSEEPQIRFFRFWTAKEAVLKAEGVGFSGFSFCRIHSVESDHELTVDYRSRKYRVDQFFSCGHIAAVVCVGEKIVWELASENFDSFNPE